MLHPEAMGGQGIADGRRARSAATEQRIVDAATRLFLEQGYARTTLSQVAEVAGTSARTVYVRFATKAALLTRVADVAAVGDLEDVPVLGRAWAVEALRAPELDARIRAWAAGAADLARRLAPLMAVTLEAEASEPLVRDAFSAARAETSSSARQFWAKARDDGLLTADADVDWLGQTTGLLGAAETALLRSRLVDADWTAYRDWVVLTWTRLAAPWTPTDARPPAGSPSRG